MELKDFIAETIQQITDGVLKGDKYLKKQSNSEEGVKSGYAKIDFDLTVTTKKDDENGNEEKISVVEIVSADTTSSKISSILTQNRIKFDVTINIETNDVSVTN